MSIHDKILSYQKDNEIHAPQHHIMLHYKQKHSRIVREL